MDTALSSSLVEEGEKERKTDYEKLAEEAGRKTMQWYDSLPRKGKPGPHEWSILASFLLFDNLSNELIVVALGSGSKCLGQSAMVNTGDMLFDSHAEVIAKRAFQRYLYQQLEDFHAQKPSVFIQNNSDALSIKPNLSFHLYISQTPCGDASIYPLNDQSQKGNAASETTTTTTTTDIDSTSKNTTSLTTTNISTPTEKDTSECTSSVPSEDEKNQNNTTNKRLVEDNDSTEDSTQVKRFKLDNNKVVSISLKEDDIQRTGAKCVAGEQADSKKEGAQFHTTGVLRTKPGRGDPTLSMSCSDKIARWNVIGVQGSLLATLMKPIYLHSVIVGELFNETALQRALYDRITGISGLPAEYKVNNPKIIHTNVIYANSKPHVEAAVGVKKAVAGGFSINASNGIVEATIANGKKIGTIAKNFTSPKQRSSLCKLEQLLRFKSLQTKINPDLTASYEGKTYSDLKQLSETYQKAKQLLLQQKFSNWIVNDKKFECFQ